MPAFGVAVDGLSPVYDKPFYDYIQRVNGSLKEQNFLKNPFTGKVIIFKDFVILDIEPLWVDLTPLYIFGLVFFTLIFGVGFWTVVLCCLLATHFFWTKTFYLMAMRRGLKKAGYKRKVKLIKGDETIRRLVKNGTA